MSRLAAFVVRLAAGTLPPSIRGRYREEWTTDVATASEAGLTPGSVARGAIVFSATLDRDVPEIAGFPVPVIAQRHARWALALVGVTAVLALARYLIEPVWLPLVVLCIAWALTMLWRAARIAGFAGRASATLATTAFAALVAGSTIPGVNDWRYFYLVATLALVVSFSLGVRAWTKASPLLIIVIGLVGAVAAVVAAWYFFIDPFVIGAVAAAGGLAWMMLSRTRSGTRQQSHPAANRTRAAVWATSVGLLAIVAIGALDALVATPLWMSPRNTLGEVYAAMPEGIAAIGIGDVAIWAAFCTIGIVGYLVLGLRFAHRATQADAGLAIFLAIAIAAVALAFQPYASAYLVQAVVSSAEFVGFGIAPIDTALRMLTTATLVVAIVGWIAPRRVGRRSATPPIAAT